MSFSCLISLYKNDSSTYLEECFKSLFHQTLPASQIVLIQDGPIGEELSSVVKNWTSCLPIEIFKNEKNFGLGMSLKKGLENCKYEFVVRMDADDICHPKRFEKQIKFLKNNPDIDILGSWARDIDENGVILKSRKYPTSHVEIINIIWSCPLIHPTVAFRKNSILSIGSYRTDLVRRQDYELWLRAAANGLKFSNLPEFLLDYRFTNDYYKKNNFRVSWLQARLGIKGLLNLRVKNVFPYVAVFFPVLRAVLPSFIERSFHEFVKRFDPRISK